jgi:hypothetical protein
MVDYGHAPKEGASVEVNAWDYSPICTEGFIK